MPKRIIKHRFFSYFEEQGKNRVERLAQRGDEVNLSAEDAERGDRLGSFVTKEDEAAAAVFSASTASVAEIQNWIEEDSPTVQQVLDATGGDADVARRVLEAEEGATGGDPRKGVTDGVAHIIANQG